MKFGWAKSYSKREIFGLRVSRSCPSCSFLALQFDLWGLIFILNKLTTIYIYIYILNCEALSHNNTSHETRRSVMMNMLIIVTYRGYKSLIETSFIDASVELPDLYFDDSATSIGLEFCSWRRGISGSELLDKKNAGREGIGRVTEKLVSMRTIFAMVGLSTGFS